MPESPAAHRGNSTGKYLTFALGDEEFGIPILKVREILGRLDITSIPRVPSYVSGVINLRGKVIPVIDLRTKLGMPPIESTAKSCITVVEIPLDDRVVGVGVVIDSVSEVLSIPEDQIEEPTRFGETDGYVLGLAKVGNRVKILLDINRIISTSETTDIHHAMQAA